MASILTSVSRTLESFVHGIKRRSDSEDIDSRLKTKRQRLNPSDRDSYDGRVSTFVPGVWPSFHAISPLEAARYGWKLTSKDVLQCISCRNTVYVRLPADADPVVYEKMAATLRPKITSSGHRKFCPWPISPSPTCFKAVKDLDDANGAEDRFKGDVKALEDLKTVPNVVRVDGVNVESLVKLINGELSSDLENRVLMALVGWKKKTDTVIHCQECKRQCAVWNYCVDEKTNRRVPPKKRPLDGGNEAISFHPVNEHQSWCPWVAEENGGFRTLVKSLENRVAKDEVKKVPSTSSPSSSTNVDSKFKKALSILDQL